MNNPNAIQHFQQWFCEVRDHFSQVEVNAMVLTTLEVDGFPKNRMVLLKQYTWEGFVFYTQYTSAKGKAMVENPKVSLSFPWEKANKRITIKGTVEKTSKTQSEAYFETRPRGSQLCAWASQQSEPIQSRELLAAQYKKFGNIFEGISINKPERWGGYLVRPVEVVFEELQNKSTKFIKYTLENGIDWKKTAFFLPK